MTTDPPHTPDNQPRVFFILGSPRSGTTLLQTMLMQAPGVTIPPETHFVSLTHDRRAALGPITSDQGWRAAAEIIAERNRVAEFPIDAEALLQRLDQPGQRSYPRMLREWLALCAEQAGVTTVGEKSPGHTAHIRRLARWFPEARFVHIVRDPRDVALSHIELWQRSPLRPALRWRLDQRTVRRAAADLPNRVMTVRYEDLATDPEPAIRRACAFLGLDFAPKMTDPTRRADTGFAAHETHKRQTLEKVTTNRIHRYRGRLAAERLALVQTVCGPEMRRLGYELEPASALRGYAAAAAAMPALLAAHANRRRRIKHNPAPRANPPAERTETPNP